MMISKAIAILAMLFFSSGCFAQQSNGQYFQEQQQQQQRAFTAEQARQGYANSQQQSQVQQPAGKWETTWGAIAGNSKMGILGASTGMADKKSAVASAIADCRSKGGGDECKLDLPYHNQCAVLVTGDKLYAVTSASSIQEAANIGVAKCAREDVNCRVFYSACTAPKFVRY